MLLLLSRFSGPLLIQTHRNKNTSELDYYTKYTNYLYLLSYGMLTLVSYPVCMLIFGQIWCSAQLCDHEVWRNFFEPLRLNVIAIMATQIVILHVH